MSVQYYEGVGRRKESTARVRVMTGSGRFIVNEKPVEAFFTRTSDLIVATGTARRASEAGIGPAASWSERNRRSRMLARPLVPKMLSLTSHGQPGI